MTEDMKTILDAIGEVKHELTSEIQSVRTELKDEIQSVRTELKDEIQSVRTELKQDINQLDSRVHKIELTLENEVIPGIKVVAEGHDFLIHKFDEAVRETYRSREVSELVQLRLNAIETDVAQLKAQYKALA